MIFADRLMERIKVSKSFLVAGFDPVVEALPPFCVDQFTRGTQTSADAIYELLVGFHQVALDACHDKVAAVKPNIAFFEQYGVAGLKAFKQVCELAKERGLLVIADVKRGDIGSTAKAYSKAFLGKSTLLGKPIEAFNVDAITISPYLGFDTIETYFDDCREFGKGLFVLVKTSNPGSAALQNHGGSGTCSVAEAVADWLGAHANVLEGKCGYSGLGAVVGATYPKEATALRARMPKNLFLIPGMGAQGGSAVDAVAGFSSQKSGALINVSRGLLAGFPQQIQSIEALSTEISERATRFNADVSAALR